MKRQMPTNNRSMLLKRDALRVVMRFLVAVAVVLVAGASFTGGVAAVQAAEAVAEPAAPFDPDAYQLVIMDPLAAPLSCPCVEGYAQRKYEALEAFLEEQTNEPFQLTFVESLKKYKEKYPEAKPDLVVGKSSVVRFDAQVIKVPMQAVARLSDLKGNTTQHGLIVVRTSDTAQSVKDLQGYRIFYGPADSDEKHRAAMELLKGNGIEISPQPETCSACSDGATRLLEMDANEQGATVISSYAAPLLEGCGTIQKGDLRVIGKTTEVPFVTAFVAEHVPAEQATRWRDLLLATGDQVELCVQLESLLGFVPIEGTAKIDNTPPASDSDKTSRSTSVRGWLQWRGEHRDGHCDNLPDTLPENPPVVWSEPLITSGLGGIAATDEIVILGDRDVTDMADVLRCYDAATGVVLWEVSYAAPGKLDYGNSPRATPLIAGNRVFLNGAMGQVVAVDTLTGELLWKCDLNERFGKPAQRPWGHCASPLLVEGKLIVHPGTPAAAIAALDVATGQTAWQTAGPPPRYGSFISRQVGEVLQIIGQDEGGLAGWNAASGELIWRVTPEQTEDFCVATPANAGEFLVVCSENNGTRLYRFGDGGKLIAQPVATYPDLAPDMSSPLVVGSRVFCAWNELYCLELENQLQPVWLQPDADIPAYAPLFSDGHRVLVVGSGGTLLLLDAHSSKFTPISRVKLFPNSDAEIYSHPAIVGNRLYLRAENQLVCIDLG
jgi:outer membrane protein assembly factor BamB/ABC-type phosphate/phosphonate transport system substrate-binding protein